MTAAYLDKPEQWDKLIEHAYKTKLMGLDSETYGHNVKESTPAYRAKIHVWSVAFENGVLHPRGYIGARGAVLPVDALSYPAIRAMLADKSVIKPAHNGHHDQHAFENHGIIIGGMEDTLDLARLAWPERALDKRLGFQLKSLEVDVLGIPERHKYKDIVNDKVTLSIWKLSKHCRCGIKGCKRRLKPDHEKVADLVETFQEKKVLYALETIVSGHKKWLDFLEYAASDAIGSLCLRQVAWKKIAQLEGRLPPLPW